MANSEKEEPTGKCSERCPLDCFVLRFLWATVTFILILVILTIAVKTLDKFDIVHKCLVDFKPYAASLPWILLMVFITLLLCIPSVTTEIRNLLGRMESIGSGFKFRPKQDNETESEAKREIEGTNGKDKVEAADKLRMLILKKIEEIRHIKRSIIQLHGDQIQSNLVSRNVGINGSDLHFDARYKDGRKETLAKVFSLSSSTIGSFCDAFDSLQNDFIAEEFVLHILIYFQENLSTEEKRKGISRILWITSRLDFVKAYFYSVAVDGTITPTEEIP